MEVDLGVRRRAPRTLNQREHERERRQRGWEGPSSKHVAVRIWSGAVGARMRRLAAAALLALPALLAFGRGGYFPVTRVRVAILACLLLAVAAIVAERPLPRSTPGRLALGGLAALTAWTGISIAWAPLGGPAFADLERLILYTAAFGAGIALLRDTRWVEPAMLATTVAAALYGLSERLTPWLVDLQALPAAGDRLAHPLTYWNGQGALAAIGLVLAAGLVATRRGTLAAAARADPRPRPGI